MDYDLITHFEAMAVLIIAIVVIFLLLDRWRQARQPRGYVYIMRGPIDDAGTGTLVKIGRTNNLARRLRQHRTTLPGCDYIHTIETADPRGLERELHRRYASKRGQGEWFALTAADLRAIRRL